MTATKRIIYPDSDGQPMAENTLQFEWITTLKSNFDWLFRDDSDVFVAGDLLWYPVEGQPTVRVAPDVLVAFGRPKGYRGSYRQWEEGHTPLTVVIEVLSPGNRHAEMINKFKFYERHGVQEYYVIDPEPVGFEELSVFVRQDDQLVPASPGERWTSPRLGVQMDLTDGLRFYHPDGQPFLSFDQVSERAQQAAQHAEEQAQRAEEQAQRAEEQAQRAEEQAQRARAAAEEAEAARETVARERAEKEAALRELAALRARLKDPDA